MPKQIHSKTNLIRDVMINSLVVVSHFKVSMFYLRGQAVTCPCNQFLHLHFHIDFEVESGHWVSFEKVVVYDSVYFLIDKKSGIFILIQVSLVSENSMV